MKLRERLNDLIPTLMKELVEIRKNGGNDTDAVRELETFRLIKSELSKYETLEPKARPKGDIDLFVLMALRSDMEKAIQAFRDSGREDLASEHSIQLEIIESFLPKIPADYEVKAEIMKWISDKGIETPVKGKDFGELLRHLSSLWPASKNLSNLIKEV